jgi:DnaJ-class molecular chaperone
MIKRKKQLKECFGCGDNFLTYKDYDYCSDCAINNNRYISRTSNCSECDGSGIIKFRGQKPRPCKLCALTKNMNKKITKLTPETQF